MHHNVNITDNNQIKDVGLIVIYLGNKCNFDCVYCDRGYIEKIGGQSLGKGTADNLETFFHWVAKQPNKITRISFHGGEPLLFIKRIKEIMIWLAPIAKEQNWLVSMTTNGSLIAENKDLFKQYKGLLAATVSYDFMFQETNREAFDIKSMAKVLNENAAEWKWQYVLPIDDPKSFSFENLQDIVRTCYNTNCRVVNIIPLRHKRGKDKFDVIIDRVNLEQYFEAFLQFIQILYIKKINVFIDGNYQSIDKNYFGNHSKLILAPDGYMYPEFDFLEYKLDNMRTGKWDASIPQVWKNLGDDTRIHSTCSSCEMKASCGLKYLYKLFEETPGTSCKKFYQYTNFVIMHNSKLKQKPNILHWAGINDNFYINT